MKEKKNKGARKVLLMCTAAVLVAAISVGVTLAYLTAQTATKTNEFRTLGAIDAELQETNYDGDPTGNTAYSFTPGQTVPKNPTIDNNSPNDKEIYVGAKVTFYVYFDGVKTAVKYSDFSKLVTVAGLPTEPTAVANIPAADSYSQGKWLYIKEDSTTSPYSRYYFYDKLLKKDGAASSADVTAALFSSVTVDKDLHIVTDGKTTTTKMSAAILSNDYDNIIAGTYDGFKYEIVINGYAVTNDHVGDISGTSTTANTPANGYKFINTLW